MDTIYDFMQGAKVTVDGVEVDYNLIMPTPSNAMARSQLDQAEEGLTMFTNKVMFKGMIKYFSQKILE